jgi:hypothetical protein
MTKKLKKIIPAQAAPVLVIVFALITLIGGGYYVWGHGTGGAPGSITPADPWAGDVEFGAHSGEPLTAAKWNALVNKVAGGGGDWKLLAESLDSTEIGTVTFRPTGVTVTETDTRGGTRHDPFFLGWPSTPIREIMLYVEPKNRSFCVGGKENATCDANCTDYIWDNTNGLRAFANTGQEAWMHLIVNGAVMSGCVSAPPFQASFPPPFDANHPGKLAKLSSYGDSSSVTCYYSGLSSVSSVGLFAYDCAHPFVGSFKYKIWYR